VLILILLIIGVTLTVVLYVGSLFFQGYFYTEPSRELYWQAPAAGGVLTAFYFLWCLLIANSGGANPRIPYDTIFRFSPSVDLLNEPAKEIWAITKDGEKKPYQRVRQGQTNWRYADTTFTPPRPWPNSGIEEVQMVIEGENHVFKLTQTDKGSYGQYVSDQGWVMKEYGDGPTGNPSMFRWGRFLMNLVLNFAHLMVWWLCLWLLIRFQMFHALGLALVLWLIITLSFLPMLLNYAADVANAVPQ